VAAILAVAWARPPIAADGALLDVLVRARAAVLPDPEPPERSRVAVIAVDARSLAAPELASYPRAFLAPAWATVLDSVMTAGALTVGFDLLLSYSANRFAADFDAPFLAALSRHRGRVVLARSARTLPAPPFLAALGQDGGALGLAELTADPDGRHRHVRARYETVEAGALPGFADAVLRRAGAPAMPATVVLAPRRHLEAIPTYALVDVLRCASRSPPALARAFAGKVVLVGTTLPEEDRRVSSSRLLPAPRSDGPRQDACGLRRLAASTPDSPSIPAVFLHAAAVEAVLRDRVTRPAPAGIVAALSAGTAAAGAAAGLALTPWGAVGVAGLMTAVLVVAAIAALAADVWVPLAMPLGGLVVTPALAYVIRYLAEERARQRIQHAFGHYLAPAIVERLARDAAALRLYGERREVTVMFADLSGFTRLSGQVDPEVLTRLLNRYLGLIVAEVEATGGYVDKFIGDAVMALWGVPVDDPMHATHGVQAAMAAVARIRREREAARTSGEPGFAIRIGLNSGPAVVGNVGTERRYNYTAVGETVNVAARLEKVPDLYACRIVVGPRTAELAGGDVVLRELDVVRVKGLDAPLAVFEPLADRTRATARDLEEARRFAEALVHYRAMRFTDAYAVWDALGQAAAECDKGEAGRDPAWPANPATRMAERARTLAAHPPARPWDGVWPAGPD
jgi:class 3 adenylate cyclase